jgi:hypothetical protein
VARKNCPVCNSTIRTEGWNMDFEVPDGWENPIHNLVCLCECGMIYYDNDKTQEDYDLYYKNRYATVLPLDTDELRLNNLVKLIRKTEPNKSSRIVDFGGGSGYIEKKLTKFGYTDVHTVNVGDELPKDIDVLILSHVLEHIYTLREVMDWLLTNVRGKVIVDSPDAQGVTTNKKLPILDYHQKHINHFSLQTLNLLFSKYKYVPTCIERYKMKPYNFPTMRIVYEKLTPESMFPVSMWIYTESQKRIEANMKAKEEKMKEITFPVVVWGCGDICMTMLKRVPLDVIHYVDNDPAFIGQTINGIPVLDHVESTAPIVIIAQMQQSNLINRIRDSGLPNKVIVV